MARGRKIYEPPRYPPASVCGEGVKIMRGGCQDKSLAPTLSMGLCLAKCWMATCATDLFPSRIPVRILLPSHPHLCFLSMHQSL